MSSRSLSRKQNRLSQLLNESLSKTKSFETKNKTPSPYRKLKQASPGPLASLYNFSDSEIREMYKKMSVTAKGRKRKSKSKNKGKKRVKK